jgi:hypothetical protein
MTSNEQNLFGEILRRCKAVIDGGRLSRCQVIGVLERKPCGTADEDALAEAIWALYPQSGLTACAIAGVHLEAQRFLQFEGEAAEAMG